MDLNATLAAEEPALAGINGPDLVWGVAAIAALLGRTCRQTNHILAAGHIPPARKIGGRWVVSRMALKLFFLEAA